MKLKELTERTGVSAATVKYWIREGILPPGRLRNTTTADYDPSHVERITLISAMRSRLGHSIEVIRTVTMLIDDPEVPVVSIMDHCQSLAIGLTRSPATRPDDPGGSGGGPSSPEAELIDRRISQLCGHLGWPDVPSGARTALKGVLAEMEQYGMAPSIDSLLRYGRALAPLAAGSIADRRVHGSRDAVALGVLIGVTIQTRYLVAMNSLAHASASVESHGSSKVAELPAESGSGTDT